MTKSQLENDLNILASMNNDKSLDIINLSYEIKKLKAENLELKKELEQERTMKEYSVALTAKR